MSGHVLYEDPKEPWKPWGHLSVPIPPPGEPDLVRLDQPGYYVPENMFTDDAGFLPHDGGEMPAWLIGEAIEIKTADGRVSRLPAMSGLCWELPSDPRYHIIAYRIVSKEPAETDTSTAEPGKEPQQKTAGLSRMRDPESALLGEHELSVDERRHRDHIAAILRQPVPGMSEWLEGPLREARRVRYREAALAPVFHGLGDKCGYHETVARLAADLADAMIAREGEDA